MIQFEDYLLLESFEIGQKPLRHSKSEMKNILIRYLSQKYKDAEAVANNILNEYRDYFIFDFESSGNLYIGFMLKSNQSKYYEVHFNRFDKVDDFSNLNDGGVPFPILSMVFNYVYWYLIDKNKPFMLSHSDPKRVRLYKSLLDKIIEKHHSELNHIQMTRKGNDIFVEDYKYIPNFMKKVMNETAS